MLSIITYSACSYLPEDYKPLEAYTLEETLDYIMLSPSVDTKQTGIMFVPGGLVDPHAYIRTFEGFAAEEKQTVLILKVRSNLAIFNSRQALKVRKEFDDKKWLIGGHSLGGVVAAMAVANEPESFEGLYLMGSYSISDISNWNKPALMLLAENDGLTNLKDIEDNEDNLPERIDTKGIYDLMSLGNTSGKTVYYTILGGNHRQFGKYGAQEGDGEASIDMASQHLEIYNVLVMFMRNNDLVD